MKIKVLGPGCGSCHALYMNVIKAVGEDKEIVVEYITDMRALIEAGIMSSPALIIDDAILSVGRVPSEDEIKEYIKKGGLKKDTTVPGCKCGGDCNC